MVIQFDRPSTRPVESIQMQDNASISETSGRRSSLPSRMRESTAASIPRSTLYADSIAGPSTRRPTSEPQAAEPEQVVIESDRSSSRPAENASISGTSGGRSSIPSIRVIRESIAARVRRSTTQDADSRAGPSTSIEPQPATSTSRERLNRLIAFARSLCFSRNDD